MEQPTINVSIGFAPEATPENAGAIRTALLAAFVQLSTKFPGSMIEPSVGDLAAQLIERDGFSDRAEAAERRDWEGSDDRRG